MGRHTLNLPLRFTGETDDRCSVYTDRYGDEVLLAHGAPMRQLVDLYDLDDVAILWDRYLAQHGHRYLTTRWRRFLEDLRAQVIDPDQVDENVWRCERCDHPSADTDDQASVNDGNVIWCEDCAGTHAWTCFHCDHRYTSTTTVDRHGSEVEVCSDCRAQRYTHCEACEVYYLDGTHGDAHEDDDEDGQTCDRACSSPARQFTLPNDGDGPLANDVRVNIALPAGVISQEGLDTIRYYLNGQDLYGVSRWVETIGPEWQTKDGNFTKRLSRKAYNEGGHKIPAAAMSHIGVIAREHSRTIDFDVEITRDLNQSAEMFANEDSCWWAGYHWSRCTLKSNGGFGLRTFAKDTGGYTSPYPEGRAWVLPLKLDGYSNGEQKGLEPTFDTHDAAAFFVFNGYGNLDGYIAARIIAHMVGGTYRKVSVSVSRMYVNNDNGYLVGPEDVVAAYTDGHLSLGSLAQHSDLYDSETRKVLAHV